MDTGAGGGWPERGARQQEQGGIGLLAAKAPEEPIIVKKIFYNGLSV
jgi:hypothetical protein